MAYIPIQVSDLRPGMYLVEVNESWRMRPFLYNKAGMITSMIEIENIEKEGYLEAYYDPDKSVTFSDKTIEEELKEEISTPSFWEIVGKNRKAPKYRLPEATVSIAEEFRVQDQKYDLCTANIKRVMTEAKPGQIDVESTIPYLQDIVVSINKNPDALLSLAKIKTFDEYTFAHCVNVAIYSLAFGIYLGINGRELEYLGLSGLFHDIGKMKIPLTILNAPRKLTEKEFDLMKKHPEFGVDLVKTSPEANQLILEGILDHHERNSGNGYPNKKKGNEISPFGRILSICDVYDALSSKRSYKRAITPGAALATMYDMGEDMWESDLLGHFIKMVGIYPVSTPVQLSDGQIGIVIKSNQEKAIYPSVLICVDRYGRKLLRPRTIDLAIRTGLKIARTIPAKEFPYNPRTLIRNIK